ncbi:transferase hexapeptide repeat family protein [Paraneptunicella aestuarii]|uniref:acyltransferase n=1 Tax=Paraneptunicella aestuarii TaxID=2831148 RepID=UPI001E2C6F3B|nr:transferase hexapeptide repeat family protein [Paraneptunicella aestuarii]UAA37434.1 transferase hexapeptide repeat family protein [Paraneptunicella aestuarii]
MHCYALEDLIPVIDPSSFVHPTAVIIGDVIIGKNCYIGSGASLRGDFGRIVIADGCNVQENCVLHSFPKHDCIVETNGHIGHSAILHGCTIGKNALVGMNAVVMDNVVIGAESIVASCSFVKSGFECPPRSLLMGSPAKIMRTLDDDDVAWKSRGTLEYQRLTKRCLDSFREVEPLTEVQHDRPRFTDSEHNVKDA